MKRISLLFLLPAAVALAGCHPEGAHESGVGAVVKEATEPLEYDEAATVVLTGVPDTVLSEVEGPAGFFMVTARKGEIERYRCSGCHTDKPVGVSGAPAMAHGDIVLQHGESQGTPDCATCHHEGERDFLVGADGEKIDFDHSYQLCGTCHFRQKKDWAGGAHGKRVTYWAGTRIVRNCTSCHNPHAPRFARRWPATFSPPLDGLE
jgi:hypothetical protein